MFLCRGRGSAWSLSIGFERARDIERKCLWDIQVPLLCSSTVRQPTEPQVASGHRERMGTFPQRPARWAADTANKQPTLPVCTRLFKVLKDGRTSPQVSLSRVSKKPRCHPLKKVSQDRRSKAASMRSLSFSLSAAHTVVKFLVFKVFFPPLNTIRRAQQQWTMWDLSHVLVPRGLKVRWEISLEVGRKTNR